MMRPLWMIAVFAFALAGCGVEGLGTAATAGKLQADQAKQGKETMDAMKTKLDAANQATADSARKAEEAGKP